MLMIIQQHCNDFVSTFQRFLNDTLTLLQQYCNEFQRPSRVNFFIQLTLF